MNGLVTQSLKGEVWWGMGDFVDAQMFYFLLAIHIYFIKMDVSFV